MKRVMGEKAHFKICGYLEVGKHTLRALWRARNQSGLDKWEKWSEINKMKFNMWEHTAHT